MRANTRPAACPPAELLSTNSWTNQQESSTLRARCVQIDWVNMGEEEYEMWELYWDAVAHWADAICGVAIFAAWVAASCIIIIPPASVGMNSFLLATPWPARRDEPNATDLGYSLSFPGVVTSQPGDLAMLYQPYKF